jgi:hypothetical protein
MTNNEDEAVQAEDTETQQEEITNDEVEDDLDEGAGDAAPANETAEQKDARIAKLEERNGKLWARLQRDKKKPASVTAAPAPKKAETSTGLSRDETILYAKGFEEDEVEYAQKVATLQGVKATEAIKDPLFTTWKSNKDADLKKQQAQLGTSKGAKTTIKKSFDTPGLSDEDHKAMFKEMTG